MEKGPRVPFGSDIDSLKSDEKMNQGLKLKPSRAKVAGKKTQTVREEDVRVQATTIQKRREGYLLTFFDLGSRFAELMSETRLPENMGPVEKNLEAENLRELIDHAMLVNSDETERAGMGSVGLATMILKRMLNLRDKLNSLSHENHLLKMRLGVLEKTKLSSDSEQVDEQ